VTEKKKESRMASSQTDMDRLLADEFGTSDCEQGGGGPKESIGWNESQDCRQLFYKKKQNILTH
jgi:hypothetical protein